MDIKFKTVNKDKAPDPLKQPHDKYKPLFHALEEMDNDEVLIVEFENQNHQSRTAAAIYHYFGRVVMSFRRCNRHKVEYIITRNTNGQSLT